MKKIKLTLLAFIAIGMLPSVSFAWGSFFGPPALPLTGGTVTGDTTFTGSTVAAPGQPRAHGQATGSMSIPDSTFKNLLFDQDNVNVANVHEFAGDSSTMTAIGAGMYLVVCQLRFANNSTGNRLVRILVNGVSVAKQALRAAISPTGAVIQAVYLSNLADGDSVTCQGFQTSTAPLDVQATAGDTTFAMGRIW